MDFRYGGFSNDYPSPFVSSSSIYTNLSVEPPEEGLRRRSVSGGARSESFRELEKEMIREEILAEEAERRRVLEAEVRFELMMEREMMAMQSWQANTSSFIQGPPHSHHSRYQSGVLYRESGCSEVVAPFQRRPRSPEITDTTTSLQSKVSERGTFGSEDHYGQIPSGAKRKQPPPPPSSVSGGSKKKTKEWCCALCKVSMTCELDLEDHLAGKKHLAKEAGLRDDKKVTSNHKKGKKKKKLLKKLFKSGRKCRGRSGAR